MRKTHIYITAVALEDAVNPYAVHCRMGNYRSYSGGDQSEAEGSSHDRLLLG